jgi:hypothetical protein
VIETREIDNAKLIDLSGKVVFEMPEENKFSIGKAELQKGIYLFIQGTNSIRIRI